MAVNVNGTPVGSTPTNHEFLDFVQITPSNPTNYYASWYSGDGDYTHLYDTNGDGKPDYAFEAGGDQIPFTWNGSNFTVNDNVSGSLALDASGNAVGLYVIDDGGDDDEGDGGSSYNINFTGLPASSTPANAEFLDFFQDTSKVGTTGYYASFGDSFGDVHLYDYNHDGLPEYGDEGDGTPATIIWNNGSFTAVSSDHTTVGSLAYDAQGNAVGLFAFEAVNNDYDDDSLGGTYTVTPDTTTGDALIGTFTIEQDPYGHYSNIGKLYDYSGDGVVDRLDIEEHYTNQNDEPETDIDTYVVTWSDATHFTANDFGMVEFGGFDASGRPTYTIDYEDGQETHSAITWQTRDANGVVATIVDAYGTATLYDTNGDTMPDAWRSTGEEDGVTYTATGRIEGWANLSATHPTIQAVIETSTDIGDDDILYGSIVGSSSNPTQIIISEGHTVTPDTTTGDALIGTFTIEQDPYHSNTGKLYDYSGDGVVDQVDIEERYTNESGQPETDVDSYIVTWSDATHFTANKFEMVEFGGFDANGRPTYLIDDYGNENETITWQARDANGVVATISDEDGDVVTLYDNNGDTLPDAFRSTEEEDGVTYTVTGRLEGWANLSAAHPTIQAVRETTTDIGDDDIFSGTITGSSSNPTQIFLSYGNNSGGDDGSSSYNVNFNGAPASSTPANAEFFDFYQDTSRAGETGYYASFFGGESSVHLYDNNSDGFPEISYENDGDSEQLIWNGGTFTLSGESISGSLAYDASGNAVGLYVMGEDDGGDDNQDFDYEDYNTLGNHTVALDTVTNDALVGTFPIYSSSSSNYATGYLYDDSGDGVIDRFVRIENYINESQEADSDTDTFDVIWSNSTYFIAKEVHWLTLGNFDANGIPSYIEGEGDDPNISIVWQTKDSNGVIATAQDGEGYIQFYDTNDNNLPDAYTYSEGVDVETGIIEGWTTISSTNPYIKVVPETGGDNDLYYGFVVGSNSEPTDIYFSHSTIGNNQEINFDGTPSDTPPPNMYFVDFYEDTSLASTASYYASFNDNGGIIHFYDSNGDGYPDYGNSNESIIWNYGKFVVYDSSDNYLGIGTFAYDYAYNPVGLYIDSRTPQEIVTTAIEGLIPSSSGIVIDTNSIAIHTASINTLNYYSEGISALGLVGKTLLLTTGTIPGDSNTSSSFGTDNGGIGDTDIDEVINTVFSTSSHDATTLEFDFTVTHPDIKSISFDLVFGSEEYPEFANNFVDAAVVIINGVNYALFDHDPMHPLSVLSSNVDAGYFQNNLNNDFPIEYDGISHVLKIIAPINTDGSINHIKIGIADTKDHVWDSGLFISNFALGTLIGDGIVQESNDGTESNDDLTGATKSEYYDLLDGNDTLNSGGGDDIIDGGAGDDTVIYNGNFNEYDISYHDAVFTIADTVSDRDGTDMVTNVEYVQFADVTKDASSLLAPAPITHDLTGNITFWKTGEAITDVTTTLTALPTDGTHAIELKNIHVTADGSHTVEVWATSTTEIASLQLAFSFSTNASATWNAAEGLASNWMSAVNTTNGAFELASMTGVSPLPAGTIKLGTLTLSDPTNPDTFELAMTYAQLGSNDVAGYAVSSVHSTTGSSNEYSYHSLADGHYALTGNKAAGDAGSAVHANDALAALKMAVALNPNEGENPDAVSPYQFLAADINRDGKVRANDALNILKMAVGIESAPVEEWIFVSEAVADKTMDRSHVDWSDLAPTIDFNNTAIELDLIGIVKGDVDGSWAA